MMIKECNQLIWWKHMHMKRAKNAINWFDGNICIWNEQRMQSIDLMETYAYETSKDLVSKREGIKYNNIIKWYKND